MKKLKKALFGAIMTIGFIIVLCCDTQSDMQLLIVSGSGLAIMLFGGVMLSKTVEGENNDRI